MTTSFFYLQSEKNAENSQLLDSLELYANEKKQQTYVVNRPLGDSKYEYAYNQAFVILAPNHKITFVDYGVNEDEFNEYVEDFIEDLGSISDKFRYKEIIGRPRTWRNELISVKHKNDVNLDIDQLMEENRLEGAILKKRVELLISLLTGSINDIEKVKAEVPQNILDKIKQKIVLFDGDQTRFIYQQPQKRKITIQGLSGTGKTELLLHKLREIYVETQDTKVIFTCHNKILADSLRSRIPEFFNFMRVEEQIKWNERLWCVNAWGSQYKPNSGAYSYICNFYNIGFLRYSYATNFDYVCKKAISDISEIEEKTFAFDYMLIDESQDFPESFFQLCELVTQNTVYIAGDIFQSIFDDRIIKEIQPDFLLSKCYRTDPKTLMFAHSLGMGLFESPKLRWLRDEEWKACGYLLSKDNISRQYELTREPLRRFEDLEQEGYSSIELVKTSKELEEDAEKKIIEIIRRIRNENPTVTPDDIGIIFIDNSKNTYLSADRLELSIPAEFGWNVNKAYESKHRVKGALFISNRNNVKGLEFPFVICVTKKINNSRSYRNALYMMITRSFLRSYLLISQDSNIGLVESLDSGLETIKTEGLIRVTPPSDDEIQAITTSFNYTDENISFYDFVESICEDVNVLPLFRKQVFESVKGMLGESFDYQEVREIVEFTHAKLVKAKKQ